MYSVDPLGQVIHRHQDGIVALQVQEFSNHVYGDHLPASVRDFVGDQLPHLLCREGLHLVAHCKQENGSMCILPMETSFSHWNTSLLSQDKNPIIGRIFAGNPNIQFLRCLPNRDVISSLNPPNSHDPNGGTYVQIGGLLKEK